MKSYVKPTLKYVKLTSEENYAVAVVASSCDAFGFGSDTTVM